jgi:phospholipid transport system substrate-binding protein
MKKIVLLLLLVASAPALAALGPLATIKQKNGEADRLLKAKTEPKSPADKKRKDELKAIAASLLDYNELAKRSLGAEWEKLSKTQQNEFISTLRDLTERNYLKRVESYQVVYRGEKVSGESATVETGVKVKTEGKTSDVEVIYHMHHVGEHWLVYDIVTDEVSLVTNYRSQFTKIIHEKGYAELIRKMKKRLAEDDT